MTTATWIFGEISMVALVTGTLSGNISNFGFCMDLGNNGDHFRIDDDSVTVPPEPSPIGITSITLIGLIFYSRRRKPPLACKSNNSSMTAAK